MLHLFYFAQCIQVYLDKEVIYYTDATNISIVRPVSTQFFFIIQSSYKNEIWLCQNHTILFSFDDALIEWHISGVLAFLFLVKHY